jgi:hypothetical protein
LFKLSACPEALMPNQIIIATGVPIAIAGSVGFIMIGTGIEGVTSGLGFIHIKAELRSNTMKSGVHQQSLGDALSEANQILILKPENQDWDINALFSKDSLFVCVEDIVDELYFRVFCWIR